VLVFSAFLYCLFVPLVDILLFLSLDDLDFIVAFEAIYCQDKSVKNRVERCSNIYFDFTIFYELIVKTNRALSGLFVVQTASEKITFSTN
jgi:hypothetical protein